MDDQNKKNPFDEFFENKPEGEKSSEAKADDHYSANQHEDEYDQDGNANGDPNSNKSTYYYSYGPYKPGSQDGRYNSFRQQPEAGDHTEERTVNQDYQSSNAQQGEDEFEESPAQEQVEYATIEQPQHLRLAPVSAAAQPRGGWKMKEKRRGRMRGILAAYLAGVITIGALMYAADTNNWFTNNGSAALGGSSGSAVTASASADNSGAGVSNAADVVRPNNIAKIFEQASPAVVKIETYVKQQQRSSSTGNGMFDDPFFRQFFGDDSQGQSNNQQDDSSQSELTPAGIGTGFFFDESGYILTNQHVIADSDEIQVTVQGYDKPFTAKLLGSSYDLDLAVLKVEGTQAFPTLALGSSDDINIGDWVVAIGNPYGFDHTVTTGILSAKERPIDIQDDNGTRNYKHLLQTDASINPGNSGGPLLNLQGEVVGINTAVSSQAQGIGFAIPTSTIKEVVDSLKNNQEIPKAPVPFIGIELANLTAQYAKQLGLDTTDGVLVTGVYYKSPAYLADVRQYDVITGVDGKSYATSDKLVEVIQSHAVGDKVVLNVIRDGKKIELTVTIGDKNQFSTEQQQQQQQ
ncbi:S1-C subfamily serine protease [Paenibacillus cellulosilyticus]|uniref:S1-C subfamily serine protease n=1 Tax=Paenibacillus cellulosilyticus TaxID=375489 RepID=A0A2V2YY08_9BACL|nr:S1-C subfamily serine protease [Paenibacillus cellulosilyticus]QKS48732.1 trypsin-like peptidase domain-containing protein [Paenibacillus cellulosilyticus]